MKPYEMLATTLDKIPNGFPAGENDEHLRVLEWIFTPEEAELASKLKLRSETIEQISERLDIPLEGLEERLETMYEKGQIRARTSSKGVRIYSLIPFAVGIYEEQLGRMDEEFAKRFEAYYQAAFSKIAHTKPVIFKVLPVNQSVSAELKVHPYDIAEEMVQNAMSWGVRECICKAQQGLLGNDCKYPTTVCLLFAPRSENAYDNDELTKTITKDEALKLLKDAEDAGLVHCTMNTQSDHYYICNCCTCCCGILRGLDTSDNPRAFVRTEFVARVNADLCTGCETCLDRCQFGALSIPEDIMVVDTKRCIGCGVCAVVCPEGALEIVHLEPTEKTDHPEGLMDWMTQRAISRDVDPSDLL